jgi:hypothetical protein
VGALLRMESRRTFTNIGRQVGLPGQNVQHFVTNSPWSAADVLRQVRREIAARPELQRGAAMERADRACRPEPGGHVPGVCQRPGLDLGRRGAVPAGAVVRPRAGRGAQTAGRPDRPDVPDQGRAGLGDDPAGPGGGAAVRGGRVRRAVRPERVAAGPAGLGADRVPGQRAGRCAGLPGGTTPGGARDPTRSHRPALQTAAHPGSRASDRGARPGRTSRHRLAADPRAIGRTRRSGR